MPDNPKTPQHIIESVIASKAEHIDEVAQPKIQRLSARQEAYQRIVDETKRGMMEYYARHPERAVDERSQDAEQATLHGLRGVFNILDGYNISFRNEATAHEYQPDTPATAETGPESGGPDS